MSSRLVATKLFVPPVRDTFVARPRVGSRLDRAAKLTVVSAPAGFGKTTALAAWVADAASQGTSVAWLSCEAGEQDPQQLWTYVVSAIQRVEPEVGTGALALLQTANGGIEPALTVLVNDLGALPRELVLVLDDYHLADGAAVATGMRFLLDHLPPQARLVVSTRVDPDLPLARLRARGELLEVRARALRFTLEEVGAYVRATGQSGLSAADVQALEQRTEGWAAALQLAALSMEGRDDPAAFIAGFAGDDRYVVDYLVDEVLSRQPEGVRAFLLRTSVLDRLTGPLCDAVTGRSDGRAMLDSLERANLFVVPLDDRRQWYRYHHLFADVLRTHLLDVAADEVSTLHRCASDWYSAAGEPEPAVRHAHAAGDADRVAELVELAIPQLRRDRREATVVGWLDVLPPEVVRARPVLAIGLVSALMARNEFETVPARLDELEQVLADGAPVTVVDEAELARLPASIQLYRGALALVAGDDEATHRHAALAAERAPAGDDVTPASAAAVSALAHWAAGDLEAAHRGYTACMAGLERAGHLSDVLGCAITVAEIRFAQGRLDDARATFERALSLSRNESQPLRGTPDMLTGLARVALERGDLTGASGHLDAARALGEGLGLPQHPYRWRVVRAGVLEAMGDVAGAAELLAEAQQVYVGDFNPDVRPVAALRVRVLLAAGRRPEAVDWARRSGLSSDDAVSYLHECEHVALARVLVARAAAAGSQTDLGAAQRLLGRLLKAAEDGGRTGTVVEVLVVQALAHLAVNDRYAASSAVARALTLAEPQGWAWVLAREAAPVVGLVRALARERAGWAFAQRVLDLAEGASPGAVASDEGATEVQAVASPGTADRHREPQVEPLSRREKEILRLLATDLSGPDIARELVVSLNTVRTHTRNVYAKLGVSNRRAAVRRAGELDLLSGRP